MKTGLSSYYIDGGLKPYSEKQQSSAQAFAFVLTLLVSLAFIISNAIVYILADTSRVSPPMQASLEGLAVMLGLIVVVNVPGYWLKHWRQALRMGSMVLALPVWCLYLYRSQGMLIAMLPFMMIIKLLTLSRGYLYVGIMLSMSASLLVVGQMSPAVAAISFRYIVNGFLVLLPLYVAMRSRHAPREEIQKKVVLTLGWIYLAMGPVFVFVEQWWPIGISLYANLVVSFMGLLVIVASRWLSAGWLVLLLMPLIFSNVLLSKLMGEQSLILMLIGFYAGYFLMPKVVYFLLSMAFYVFCLVQLNFIADDFASQRLGLFLLGVLASWMILALSLPIWMQDLRKRHGMLATSKNFTMSVMLYLVRVLVATVFIGIVVWPLLVALQNVGGAIAFTPLWTLVCLLFVFIAGWLVFLISDFTQRHETMSLLAGQTLEAAQKKAQFVSTLSHEMRTPLNGLLGMLQLLEMNPRTPVALNEPLQLLRYNGDQLQQTVEDLLDIGRLQQGKLKLVPETRPLSALSKIFEANIKQSAAFNMTTFHFINKVPPTAWATFDESRVGQLIDYFVSATLKHCGPSDDLTVYWYLNGDCFLVSIDSPYSREVFEQWQQQSYAAHSEYKHLMLRLVELLEVKIQLEVSALNGKPSLKLAFDMSVQIKEDTGAIGAMSTSANNKAPAAGEQRMLVVDDDKVNRTLIELALKQDDLLLDTASSAQRALDMLAQQRYDLVVTDISMPTMSGEQLLAAIRAAGHSMPLIAVTGNVSEADTRKYRALGFADVVHKPVNIILLRKKIAQCLAG